MNRKITAVFVVVASLCISYSLTSAEKSTAPVQGATERCPADTSGLKLPPGFCATIFADHLGHPRQMVVAPDGVLYVNTWSGRYFANSPTPPGGFIVALQDTKGAGKADVIKRFGSTPAMGGHGGSGIALYKDAIYAEINDRIDRYPLSPGSIVSTGHPETIVSKLPLGGDHPMHPFFITGDGQMYVDVATATNSCQQKNRMLKSPGLKPCTELETRGGVWLFDANKTNQVFSPAQRYATGIRNAEGLATDEDGHMLATQHGRDQLHANWPEFYQPDQEATLPSEELLLLRQNGDYGWPECYYDPFVQKLVLAPEYGGNGKEIGECANKIAPIAAFPAHWAPNDMVRYDKDQFPSRYKHGVFIAFHGSWDRAPYAQGGYNVVFQPLEGHRASGDCEIFADGFAGPNESPATAEHRPSGLAVGPDGALYVSDDTHGRIYRIVYRGGANFDSASVTKCPSNTAPAGPVVQAAARPPEGTHPNAGAARTLPVPPGSTLKMVELGERVYRGEAGGAACTGCHGDMGQGTPLGPALRGKQWLWSNGSYAGIKKTITEGVPKPKEYRSPMPPMGGAQLTPEQVSAVAAYVWSISHPNAPKGK
ncbi:MAG TPA: c-type cytochrome [Terriglobales bacterium]|nr:c-type cytochrome [Terriglobales bacterium]